VKETLVIPGTSQSDELKGAANTSTHTHVMMPNAVSGDVSIETAVWTDDTKRGVDGAGAVGDYARPMIS